MTHGDQVIVVDESSSWFGRQGEISAFTLTGGVGVEIGGRVEVFDPQQLELAHLVTSERLASGRSVA
jgi:hypothetical protein